MKRVLLAVIALLMFSSCGDGVATDAPHKNDAAVEALTERAAQQAFLEWMAAENDGDCEGVKARVTRAATFDCDALEERVGTRDGLVDDEKYLGQYAKVTIHGESAVMEIEDHTDEILAWDLERVDGRWLIVIDADDA